jgi:hypothetical protein
LAVGLAPTQRRLGRCQVGAAGHPPPRAVLGSNSGSDPELAPRARVASGPLTRAPLPFITPPPCTVPLLSPQTLALELRAIAANPSRDAAVEPLDRRLSVNVKESRRTASSRGRCRCLRFASSCLVSPVTPRRRSRRRHRPPLRASCRIQDQRSIPLPRLSSLVCALCFGAAHSSNRAPPLDFASSPVSSRLAPPQLHRRRPVATSWANTCVPDRPIEIRRIRSVLTRVRTGQTRVALVVFQLSPCVFRFLKPVLPP